jgi:hypothetical protein
VPINKYKIKYVASSYNRYDITNNYNMTGNAVQFGKHWRMDSSSRWLCLFHTIRMLCRDLLSKASEDREESTQHGKTVKSPYQLKPKLSHFGATVRCHYFLFLLLLKSWNLLHTWVCMGSYLLGLVSVQHMGSGSVRRQMPAMYTVLPQLRNQRNRNQGQNLPSSVVDF